MKIINKNWQRKIEIEDNIIYTLVFENKKYYRENIIELINQHNGNEGSYILSNDNKEISFDKNSYIITDIFNIEINNKKVLSKIYSSLLNTNVQELLLFLIKNNIRYIDFTSVYYVNFFYFHFCFYSLNYYL